MRLHIVAGGRQSHACGWATPPPACVCRCKRTSPKAPPWPHAPHSQMCLPLPPSCTRCWVDLSCCVLVAEQEQDLCGQCRAAPKWARRRVAGGNFSRPPAPPPTHLPARPDPHRSQADPALAVLNQGPVLDVVLKMARTARTENDTRVCLAVFCCVWLERICTCLLWPAAPAITPRLVLLCELGTQVSCTQGQLHWGVVGRRIGKSTEVRCKCGPACPLCGPGLCSPCTSDVDVPAVVWFGLWK